MQYSNFKDTLQNIASQIGNVEQEVEEHKYVASAFFSCLLSLLFVPAFCSVICDPVGSPSLDYNDLLAEREDICTTILYAQEQKHDACSVETKISLSLNVRCTPTPPSHLMQDHVSGDLYGLPYSGSKYTGLDKLITM